jgi:hypothetical protein
MTYYAGIDLSMKTTAVCIVDEAGKKIASASVESTPETTAEFLLSVGQPDRCVIEKGRMSSANSSWPQATWHQRGLYRRLAGPSKLESHEGEQDRS